MTLRHLNDIHEPAVRAAVDRAAATDLEQRLVSGLPAYGMALSVMLVGTPFLADHPRLVISMVGTFVAVLLARWRLGRRPRGSFPSLEDGRHRAMRVLAVGSGLLWGAITGLAVHFYGPSFTSMLLLFLTASFAAGASSSMSLDRKLAGVYFVVMVGPSALRGLFSGATSVLTISVPSFFFLAFVWGLLRSNHRVYWSSILDAAALQQKTAELERARDAAESSSRSRTAFLATVSHELRTPLHGVLGLLRLLADSKLEREQRDQVEMAQRSAGDLLHHINDILDYTKFATKGLEEDIQVGPLDVREVVEDTLDLMAERAASNGLDLASFVARDVPAVLLGDAFRLRQVLMNLVSNAIKFTEVGQVTVEVAGAPIGVDGQVMREGDASGLFRLEMAVTDTGIGIAGDAVEGLFNPFSQADSSIARRFGGTGLGLAIVKGLCKAMGGDVLVESSPDVGSRFRCHVLLGVPAVGQSQPGPASLLPAPDGQVLIVSPHLPSTQSLMGLMQEAGYEVALVSTREEVEPWRRSLPEHTQVQAVFVDEGQLADVKDGAVLRLWLAKVLRVGTSPQIFVLATVGRKPLLAFDGVLSRPVRRSLLGRVLTGKVGRSEPEGGGTDPSRSTQALAIGAGLRVLVVDDNPVNRLIALRFLEKMGCLVELASDGVEGLAKWEASSSPTYDLILMDCQMPQLDGLAATRLLRQRESGTHVPVIAMTASAALEDRERCLAAGMDDFLPKPVTFEALAEAVGRWAKRAPADH